MNSYPQKQNLFPNFPANTDVGLDMCSTKNFLSMLHVWLMTCWKWWIFTFPVEYWNSTLGHSSNNFFLDPITFSGCQVISQLLTVEKTKTKKSLICVYSRWKKMCAIAHIGNTSAKTILFFIYSIRTRTRSRKWTRARTWTRARELTCPPTRPQKRQRTRTWPWIRARQWTLTWSQTRKRTLTPTRKLAWLCMDRATVNVHAATRTVTRSNLWSRPSHGHWTWLERQRKRTKYNGYGHELGHGHGLRHGHWHGQASRDTDRQSLTWARTRKQTRIRLLTSLGYGPDLDTDTKSVMDTRHWHRHKLGHGQGHWQWHGNSNGNMHCHRHNRTRPRTWSNSATDMIELGHGHVTPQGTRSLPLTLTWEQQR